MSHIQTKYMFKFVAHAYQIWQFSVMPLDYCTKIKLKFSVYLMYMHWGLAHRVLSNPDYFLMSVLCNWLTCNFFLYHTESSSTTTIIGVVLGVIIFLILCMVALLVGYWYYKRKKSRFVQAPWHYLNVYDYMIMIDLLCTSIV